MKKKKQLPKPYCTYYKELVADGYERITKWRKLDYKIEVREGEQSLESWLNAEKLRFRKSGYDAEIGDNSNSYALFAKK